MAQVGQAFKPVMTGKNACPTKTDNANAGEKLYDFRLSLRRDNIARQNTSVRIELDKHMSSTPVREANILKHLQDPTSRSVKDCYPALISAPLTQ